MTDREKILLSMLAGIVIWLKLKESSEKHDRDWVDAVMWRTHGPL